MHLQNHLGYFTVHVYLHFYHITDDVVEPDLLEIPGPNEDSGDHVSKIVFYDLETTGLGIRPHNLLILFMYSFYH